MPYWCGSEPDSCDICNTAIESSFIDGATIYGPWAMMCERCHRKVGRGIGLGRGQRYEVQAADDRWLKVAG